jgi:3-phenylpropionate/trans-cinnamate dioxygenase ferredoxin component
MMLNYTALDESKLDFIEIAPASELPNGERLFVDIGNRPIVIFNIAGQFFAIGDVCTHDDGPLGDGDLEGFNIVCPRQARSLTSARGR